MSNLELRFHTERLRLTLGEPLDAFQTRLGALQISRVEDRETDEVRFAETLQARGFELAKRKFPFATDLLSKTLLLHLSDSWSELEIVETS